MHVPDEKRKKLGAKSEKFILVGYSHEQNGYKCYNPRTKQVRVSRDIVFDETVSSYSLPTPESNLVTKDEAEIIREEEEDYGTLDESLISFRFVSGPNEELSRDE